MNTFWYLITLIGLNCQNSHSNKNETCFNKFCFTRSENRNSQAEECQIPYWNLEIYDKVVFSEVSKFVSSENIPTGFVVPLSMRCELESTSCIWISNSQEVTFNKFKSGVSKFNERTVYFNANDLDSWQIGDISGHPAVKICMRFSRDSSRLTHNIDFMNSNVLIICTVMGLASVALFMLLIALLLLLSRRKKQRLNTPRASRTESINNHRLIVPYNSSELSQPAFQFGQTPLFCNTLEYRHFASSSNNNNNNNNMDIEREQVVNYADLVWSTKTQTNDSKDARQTRENAISNDFNTEEGFLMYENSSIETHGPNGDQYSLVDRKK